MTEGLGRPRANGCRAAIDAIEAIECGAGTCWHLAGRPREMAGLSVRRIESEVCEGLRVQAARHGASKEEEVRRILRRAVAAPERLGELAVECFGPAHGVELELAPREPDEPPELGS